MMLLNSEACTDLSEDSVDILGSVMMRNTGIPLVRVFSIYSIIKN